MREFRPCVGESAAETLAPAASAAPAAVIPKKARRETLVTCLFVVVGNRKGRCRLDPHHPRAARRTYHPRRYCPRPGTQPRLRPYLRSDRELIARPAATVPAPCTTTPEAANFLRRPPLTRTRCCPRHRSTRRRRAFFRHPQRRIPVSVRTSARPGYARSHLHAPPLDRIGRLYFLSFSGTDGSLRHYRRGAANPDEYTA